MKRYGSNSITGDIYSQRVLTPSTTPMTMAAVCQVTGGSGDILTLGRPSEDGLPGSRVVILPDNQFTSSVDAFGIIRPNIPVPVYYDSADGDPSVGDTVGTVADSYLMSVNNEGFRVCWVDTDISCAGVVADSGSGCPVNWTDNYQVTMDNFPFSTGVSAVNSQWYAIDNLVIDPSESIYVQQSTGVEGSFIEFKTSVNLDDSINNEHVVNFQLSNADESAVISATYPLCILPLRGFTSGSRAVIFTKNVFEFVNTRVSQVTFTKFRWRVTGNAANQNYTLYCNPTSNIINYKFTKNVDNLDRIMQWADYI